MEKIGQKGRMVPDGSDELYESGKSDGSDW